MGRYVIAVDMGTQGTKTSLYDEQLNEIANSFEQSNLISPNAGEIQQDPDEMFISVVNTVRDVVEQSGVNGRDIVSIGIDSQMSGIMGIDKDWESSTYYDSWLDTRCEKYMPMMKERCGERILELTGAAVTYDHGPKIVWWKNENPQAYAKTDKWIIPSVYAIGRICGLKGSEAFIDYTNLHFTCFADNYNKTWADELIDPFDIDKNKLPGITEPTSVVGKVAKDFAQATGLSEGMPVVAGCGDQAATAFGAGIIRKGMVYDVGGTASVFSFFVGDYKPDIKYGALMQTRSVIEGNWLPLGYINGGGLCLRWFRNELAGRDGKVSYDDLSQEAKDLSPGSGGLVFIPHFGGRVLPNDPNVRGSWIGLKFSHKREHLYRAIMEGLAYEYRFYQKVAEEMYPDQKLETVYALGGGAKSRLFNSIKADVLGLTYAKQERGDSALVGSAVIAGYGVGLFDSLEEPILKVAKVTETVQPDMDKHMLYQPYYEAYKDIIEALHPIYEREGF